MFLLPKHIVKKIILGELDYNDRPYDEENEIAKGWHAEDQAVVNKRLEKDHKPVCTVLEEICRKQACEFYSTRSGSIENGWSCSEYKVDYPTAPFDRRLHLPLAGEDRIDWNETIKNLEDLAKNGGRYVCLGCTQVYQDKPTEPYETGHGFPDLLEICPCGSDLFETIKGFIKIVKGK